MAKSNTGGVQYGSKVAHEKNGECGQELLRKAPYPCGHLAKKRLQNSAAYKYWAVVSSTYLTWDITYASYIQVGDRMHSELFALRWEKHRRGAEERKFNCWKRIAGTPMVGPAAQCYPKWWYVPGTIMTFSLRGHLMNWPEYLQVLGWLGC